MVNSPLPTLHPPPPLSTHSSIPALAAREIIRDQTPLVLAGAVNQLPERAGLGIGVVQFEGELDDSAADVGVSIADAARDKVAKTGLLAVAGLREGWGSGVGLSW